MRQRKKWYMVGPTYNQSSGSWLFRKATPTDLKNRKADLKALGIKYKGEWHRAFKARDKYEALKIYRDIEQEVELELNEWRWLLSNASVPLNHQQVIANAGEAAKKLLEEWEKEPNAAPMPLRLLFEFAFAFVSKPNIPAIYMGDPIQDFLSEINSTPPAKLARYIQKESGRDNSSWRSTCLFAAQTVFDMHTGKIARESIQRQLAERRINPDQASMERLEAEARRYCREAYLTLGDRLDGDYSPAPWVQTLPVIDSAKPRATSLTFSDVFAVQEKLSGMQLKNERKSPATMKKYKTLAKQFNNFRNDDHIHTVSVKEIEDWRDNLLEVYKQKRKTVHNKMHGIMAVVGWAIKQSKGELFDGINPLKFMSSPEPEQIDSSKKTYSREQVVRILTIARKQKDDRYRWVPWLLAHTGMRVSEALQLEKEDLVVIRGRYFLHIKKDDERSSKSKKPRYAPVHDDMISEGFCDFVTSLPDGRLFKGKSLSTDMSKWMKKWAVPEGETWTQPPSHGFRHFLEDLMSARMELRVAQYMTGRTPSGSVKDYGGGDDFLFDLSE